MIVVVTIFALLGVAGATTSVHLTLMTVASLFYREPRPGAVEPIQFLVLVPAHNEALVIGATLQSINTDRRAEDLLLVVADRCTDDTAAIARSHGAIVVERGVHEAPGRAAARQAGLDRAMEHPWDAVVMVDADSVIEPGFFAACERVFATGALALQARSEAALDRRLVAQAVIASFAIQGITLPRGRDRLGLAVRLRGTGMAIRREICEQFSFRAPASEDLWYTLDLCLAGIRPRHAESARLRSVNVGSWRGASRQKRRYEAGRMSAAREFVGKLVRRRDRASLEAAWFLASPPFAVAVLLLVVATLGEWLIGAPQWGWAFAVLTGLLVLDLVVALLAARAPARTWASLLLAPWYLGWKVVVQLAALRNVVQGAGADRYGATERLEPNGKGSDGREENVSGPQGA